MHRRADVERRTERDAAMNATGEPDGFVARDGSGFAGDRSETSGHGFTAPSPAAAP
jgi:hypothetical protein